MSEHDVEILSLLFRIRGRSCSTVDLLSRPDTYDPWMHYVWQTVATLGQAQDEARQNQGAVERTKFPSSLSPFILHSLQETWFCIALSQSTDDIG